METVDFPEPSGNPLSMKGEWAVLQVESTVNFAPNNRLLNWYVGGLNYQIEHHLFPSCPRNKLPRLKPYVLQTCAELGIPYFEQSLLGTNLFLIRHLREISRRNATSLTPAD